MKRLLYLLFFISCIRTSQATATATDTDEQSSFFLQYAETPPPPIPPQNPQLLLKKPPFIPEQNTNISYSLLNTPSFIFVSVIVICLVGIIIYNCIRYISSTRKK